MTGRLLAGLQAGGASGPAAGMPPGASAGMRGAAGAVAPHPVRPEAPLPRLLRVTAGQDWDSAAGQPRRQRRERRRDVKPCPVRQEQSPGAGGGVEKLQQLRIGGRGEGAALHFASSAGLHLHCPPCSHSNGVILRVGIFFNIHNLLKKKYIQNHHHKNSKQTPREVQRLPTRVSGGMRHWRWAHLAPRCRLCGGTTRNRAWCFATAKGITK